jgi:basic amino acid/polyamine antiporter, APA family
MTFDGGRRDRDEPRDPRTGPRTRAPPVSATSLPPHPARPATAVVAAPRPTLTLLDTVTIVVGTVVGVGIFRIPSLVGANAPSELAVLLAWVAGGLISMAGALCYAELASTYPHPGGDYHYLGRAYGARLAFLFGWARISVIQTGAIAILAFVLGDYASRLWSLGPHSSAVYAAMTVVALTGLNLLGIRHGTRAQSLVTWVSVGGLGLIVVAGLLLAPAAAPAAAPVAATGSIGLVMVFVLLTYGGWNEAAYLSAELRDPTRNMARALVSSILLVTALYLVVNWVYLRVLGLSGLAGSSAVAADTVAATLGHAPAQAVSLLVVIAALSSANAAVITGARTAYALGRDVPRLGFLGRWHAEGGTPVNALVAQGVVALALVVIGAFTRDGFVTMVEYTAPVFWFFFLLTGIALFVLRQREGGVRRPFRVPLYPLTPLVFCGAAGYLLYSSLMYTGFGALVGVGVLGAGALLLLVAGPAAQRPTGGS